MLLVGNPGGRDRAAHALELGERRGEPWLVDRERSEEALRIPGVVGRLRREKGDSRSRERTGEAEDVLCRGAAPVHEHDRGVRFLERRAGDEHRRVAMRIGETHRTRSARAVGWASTGSAAAIAARCGSSQGGSTSVSPSASGASSTAKPGPSVASSKSTPPGSLK